MYVDIFAEQATKSVYAERQLNWPAESKLAALRVECTRRSIRQLPDYGATGPKAFGTGA